MKTFRLPAAALILLLACSPGDNHRGGDTGMADSAPGGMSSNETMSMSGDSSMAVGGNTAVTPEGVLSQMNVANTTEIQVSTVASRKASSAAVKQIAKKLEADHTRNAKE